MLQGHKAGMVQETVFPQNFPQHMKQTDGIPQDTAHKKHSLQFLCASSRKTRMHRAFPFHCHRQLCDEYPYILPLSHSITLLNFSTYTYSIFRIRGRNLFTRGNDVMGYRKVLRDRDQALLGTGSSWSSICQGRCITWLRLCEPREGGL